jgi:predicted ester cyclase
MSDRVPFLAYVRDFEVGIPEIVAPLEAKRIHRALLRSAVRGYAAAKSQQDVDGALAGCAPDFRIDTIPFGFGTRDREGTAEQLALFFRAFPDYRAEPEGMAVQGDQVGWWGTVSLTSGGPLLDLPPTGRHARLPAFRVFDFRGPELLRERFFFDLAQLCEGLGLSQGRVAERLAPLRARAAA